MGLRAARGSRSCGEGDGPGGAKAQTSPVAPRAHAAGEPAVPATRRTARTNRSPSGPAVIVNASVACDSRTPHTTAAGSTSARATQHHRVDTQQQVRLRQLPLQRLRQRGLARTRRPFNSKRSPSHDARPPSRLMAPGQNPVGVHIPLPSSTTNRRRATSGHAAGSAKLWLVDVAHQSLGDAAGELAEGRLC